MEETSDRRESAGIFPSVWTLLKREVITLGWTSVLMVLSLPGVHWLQKYYIVLEIAVVILVEFWQHPRSLSAKARATRMSVQATLSLGFDAARESGFIWHVSRATDWQGLLIPILGTAIEISAGIRLNLSLLSVIFHEMNQLRVKIKNNGNVHPDASEINAPDDRFPGRRENSGGRGMCVAFLAEGMALIVLFILAVSLVEEKLILAYPALLQICPTFLMTFVGVSLIVDVALVNFYPYGHSSFVGRIMLLHIVIYFPESLPGERKRGVTCKALALASFFRICISSPCLFLIEYVQRQTLKKRD